ncbi:MAG: SBBP repeat-containing protein [Phycisphaerales bacterium]|nr:SBBP repeat-containing protein [Phycisphaerales bacterium]
MSRLIVAATLLAGSPSSAYAAGALAPAFTSKGGTSIPLAGVKAAQLAAYANLPLFFEKNIGQTDAAVKFFARADGYSLFLTATEAVMVLPPAKAAKTKAGVVVRMKLKGADAKAPVRGQDILPGRTSYMRGNDRSKWQIGVEQYAKVKFSSVYPGIDVIYYGKQGQVEHDFIVAPGANPGRILVGFEGARGLRLDARGNLVLRVEGGEVAYSAPTLYQMIGGNRIDVSGRYVLAGKNHVRFEVGDYIKSSELVIDPVLSYSSFLGGATGDKAYAIAVDTARNAYLTGSTESTAFPTAGTPTAPLMAGAAAKQLLDVFVTKVNPAGTAMVWSLYLGGTGDDVGRGIAVDSATGRVYVTGDTTVGIGVGGFPNTATFGTGVGTGLDAFVVGIDGGSTSPTQIYANVFGGGANESGNGIAVDALGAVYVTGQTTSIAVNTFPIFATVATAAQPTAGGGASQAYVTKFTAAGALVYSTYLGGTGIAFGNAIAIDGNRNAYVTGRTGSEFFTAVEIGAGTWAAAFKPTITGAEDAFMAKLNPDGNAFLYKTYVGGSGLDAGTGIAVDGATPPRVYMTGDTVSADFPGTGSAVYTTLRNNGARTTIGGGNPNSFVFKLNTALTGPTDGVYSTYVGLTGVTQTNAIAVDGAGKAYVTGYNTGLDIPITATIGERAPSTGEEAVVMQLNSAGSIFEFVTYLGGTGADRGQGIALDSLGNIYVTGYTASNTATFPIVAGGFQGASGGGLFDAFVSKFGAVVPALCTITSRTPSSGFVVGGDTVTITGTEFNGLAGLSAVAFNGVNTSSYTVNATSTVITAVTPPHAAGALLPLVVTTNGGTCSTTYSYTAAPTASGVCGDDYFYPSPATGPTGTFSYCMESAGSVKIRVYNVIGDLTVKVDDTKPSGAALSTIDTGRLAPGVYLYILERDYNNGTKARSKVKKFVVKH